MKIGYARVSSGEQNHVLQRDALSAAGCRTIHEDEGVSGAARRRPGLDQALATMKDVTDDVVVLGASHGGWTAMEFVAHGSSGTGAQASPRNVR